MSIIRLCVLGNSHIASLKLAWAELAPRYPGIEITFFGSHKGTLRSLVVSEGCLKTDDKQVRKNIMWTSGGLDTLYVNHYDAFLMHGLFNFDSVVRRGADEFALVFDSSLARDLEQKLTKAAASDQQPIIILSPKPFFSQDVLQQGSVGQLRLWRPLFDEAGEPLPSTVTLFEQWRDFCATGNRIPQPEATVVSGCLTRREFSVGSVRLSRNNEKHDETDFYHMNSAYGVLVIEVAIARCRALFEHRPPLSALHSAPPALPKQAVDERHHPYVGLPPESFWKKTVAGQEPTAIRGWYRKKFDIGSLQIATAGSCFAQHIGRRLRRSGFNFIDTEPAPDVLPPHSHLNHGYGMYSARFGNVYTTRQLLQLFQRAFGQFESKEIYWERDGGYVDPFRPTIQPAPFVSVDQLLSERERHLAAVRQMFSRTNLFVFTLGLTEGWELIQDGSVFPVAPGVSGGAYDPNLYRLVNFEFNDVLSDLQQFISAVRAISPKMKFLLTVSPVPLMATATGTHVVTATTYSKSVLRAVAGQMAAHRRIVDYFPSFEIISSHVMEGCFYEADKRSVTEAGVDHVMQQFFAEHQPPLAAGSEALEAEDDEEVACDEALLAAFGDRTATIRQP